MPPTMQSLNPSATRPRHRGPVRERPGRRTSPMLWRRGVASCPRGTGRPVPSATHRARLLDRSDKGARRRRAVA